MDFSLMYSSKKIYLLYNFRWNYFLLKNTPYDTVFFSSQIQI